MTILFLSQDISLWPCVLLVVCAALPLTGKLRIHPLKPWYSLVVCCRLLSLGTVVLALASRGDLAGMCHNAPVEHKRPYMYSKVQ